MKKVTIEIETVNDAFTPEPGDEIGRILDFIGKCIPSHEDYSAFSSSLCDINGNTVGKITFE